MDKKFIKDCINGNRNAQYSFYKNYAPAMLGVCYRYTKNIEDAEDVLQEGFIKVFKNLYQYRFEGDVAAWIRRIMVNTAISFINKHNNKADITIDDLEMHPISNEQPDVNFNAKELVKLIQQLPVGYQTIFNLVAIEGYEQVEIAKLLKMNVNTVRSKYSRARVMLIELLE